MEPESDTQIIKLRPKDDFLEDDDDDYNSSKQEEEEETKVERLNNEETHYALFVKITVENGENYHDWIYSTTMAIPDELLRQEFAQKGVITLEFPFSEPMNIPRNTHVRAIAYWKNSEGERCDETNIYYEAHLVDEEEQKMFVRADRNGVFANRNEESVETVSELDQELKKLRNSLVTEHLDVFAPEKEQRIVMKKIRQTLLDFERQYRHKNNIETKHKLEDESLPETKEPKQDFEALPDEESQKRQQFAVLYKPLVQNESGAFVTEQVYCEIDIELLFQNQFKDLWRHYSSVTTPKENKDMDFVR